MELKKLKTKKQEEKKEEVNKIEGEIKHYQTALDITKHSKRRQELEQKISDAKEQLEQVKEKKEREKEAESDNFSVIRNVFTLLSPLNALLIAGIGLGIGTGFLLSKILRNREREE